MKWTNELIVGHLIVFILFFISFKHTEQHRGQTFA